MATAPCVSALQVLPYSGCHRPAQPGLSRADPWGARLVSALRRRALALQSVARGAGACANARHLSAASTPQVNGQLHPENVLLRSSASASRVLGHEAHAHDVQP